MSVVTAHQTDLTTFCKFKREHKLRRALHLLLNHFYKSSLSLGLQSSRLGREARCISLRDL
jgi:hypothetical protein